MNWNCDLNIRIKKQQNSSACYETGLENNRMDMKAKSCGISGCFWITELIRLTTNLAVSI